MALTRTSSRAPRLGILDWGIGGFGLYQLIKHDRPQLPITYWSDAGFTPYGKVPPRALAARVRAVAQALAADGVTHLAVACNAASTALPLAHDVRWPDDSAEPLQIAGVLEHGARAAAAVSPKRSIGIVGGRRTIRSLSYLRQLPNHRVRQRVAQPISAFIEAGELNSAALHASLDAIMQPLRNVDALVLACTHYPAIAALWQARAPRAALIDPAAHMWQWMQGAWPIAAMAKPRLDGDRYYTTGAVPAMKRAARLAFGVALSHVRKASL